MDWSVAAVLAMLAMAYVLHAHVQADRRAWPAWTLRLGGARRALLEWLRIQTDAHLNALQGTLNVAREDHNLGQSDEAIRVIRQADALAARHVRWLRALLQRWSDVTRTQPMQAPPPPAPASLAQLAPVRRLARIQHLGHMLLPRQLGFQASVRLQRIALKCVGWSSAAAVLRAKQPGRLDQALDSLDATHADLVALDGQALATLEHMLHSLPEPPTREDERRR